MSATSDVQICNMALAHCGLTILIADLAETSQQGVLCNLFYEPTRDKVLQAIPWPFARKYARLQEIGHAPATGGCHAPGTGGGPAPGNGVLELVANPNGQVPANGVGVGPDCGPGPANWHYRYLYPTDCLKFRNIVNNGYVPFLPYFYRGYYADFVQCLPPRSPFQIGLASDASSKVIYTNVRDAHGEYTALVTDPILFPQTFVNALAWAMAAELAIPLTTDMQRAQLAQTMYMTALLEAGADLLNEGEDGPQPESDFIRSRR